MAKIVHSSSAAKLYVEHSSTQTISTNKSVVNLSMYVTPTSGWEIGPWTDSGSYLGDATSDTFTASISKISKKTTLRTTSFEVTHDDDGTKDVTIYWKWGVNSSWGNFVRPSGSFTITLPQIPRAATISSFKCATAYLGGSMTVGYDCKSTSFTHKVRYYVNGTTIYTNTITPTATGAQTCSHSFNADQLAQIYTLSPNSSQVSVNAKIETYNGSDLIGESSPLAITLSIPESVVPTVSSLTVSDAAGLTGTFGGYVQGKSSAKVTVVGAGVHGSTIKSYKTTVDGVSYSGSSFTSGALKSTGTLTVSTTVTDSRGRTSTAKTTTITVYPYYAPKITGVDIYRSNSDGTANDEGTYARFKFSYDIAPVNSKNTKSVKLQYLNGSTWTNITTITDSYSATNKTYTSGNIFSNNTTYQLRIVVNDYFVTNDVLNVQKSLSTAFTLMNFKADGTAVGFGKVSEDSHIFDFGDPVRFTGGIDEIIITANTDLNSYTTSGFYRCPLTADAKTLANCPLQTAFAMTVERTTNTGCVQIIKNYSATDPLIYTRNMYNNDWGEWTPILDPKKHGLATYANSDGSQIDPDTTLEHQILTNHSNGPTGSFYYITTYFYSSKSTSSNRMQVAHPYVTTTGHNGMYFRVYNGGSWGSWTKLYSALDTTFNGNATSATKATQDGNGKVIADTYSLRGVHTSNGSAVLLWSGSATKPSFTVENIASYKFFLILPGDSSKNFATWIVVPFASQYNSSFRGIGGYEHTSNGVEVYSIRGSYNGTNVSIEECFYRGSYGSWGGGTQLYVKYVIGVM